MQTAIKINEKNVEVRLSRAAEKALAQRDTPLYAEMELYFSCLIRLKVRFYENRPSGEGVAVSDKLSVGFRPVMTEHCDINYQGDEPPLTDFPIIKASAFVPKWISIDYRHGQWTGEFGMTKPR